MKIKDIATKPQGEQVRFIGILSEKKELEKKNGEKYLSIACQDSTAKISFPAWDDFEILNEALEVGQVIEVIGNVKYWENEAQIASPMMHILDEEELKEVEISNLVPSYEITEDTTAELLEIIKSIKSPYKELAIKATGAFNHDADRWKDFTTCVAASKHHGNKRGGLLLHTLGVVKMARLFLTNYSNTDKVVNLDRLTLKAIVHDIGKIREYEWETFIRTKPGNVSHLYTGGIILTEANNQECKAEGVETEDVRLDEDELNSLITTILSHHGEWGPMRPSEDNLEDWLLHLADMVDSRIIGTLQKEGY